MLWTYHLTVLVAMNSRAAISRFEKPSPISASTSRSRLVGMLEQASWSVAGMLHRCSWLGARMWRLEHCQQPSHVAEEASCFTPTPS